MSRQHGSFKLDVEQIASLARGRNSADRARLVAALNQDLGGLVDQGSEDDQRRFVAFLGEIVSAIEEDVRVRLAIQLATSADTPRPLVALLANESIQIARPVLLRCENLRDLDLIAIIRQRTLEHQLAIAKRMGLSKAVSEELVGTGQTRVIVTLLRNTRASVREETLSDLAKQAERVNAFREPLSRRPDLPESAARRLYRLVSATIRQEIAERFDFDASVLDDDIEAVLKQATDALRSTGGRSTMAQALAAEVARGGRFDPQQLVELLKHGEIAAFEAMMIQQSGLRPGDMRGIVYDAGGEAFAVICRALGMTGDMFAEVHDLTRRASRQDQQVAEELRDRALGLFDRLDPEAATAMVGTWRQDPAAICGLHRAGDKASHGVT